MMSQSRTISIIIPVLNEASQIQRILQVLDRNRSTDHICEILVVDGGSEDSTQQLALKTQIEVPIHLIESNSGRAIQMNRGAEVAKGDILYFIHADTHPPQGYDQSILNAMRTNDAGCFQMKFDSDHPLLKTLQWFTRFNWKICRGGDQSLFISKKCFHELGGYDERYLVYEDGEFISRIYKSYSFTVLPEIVVTSARKYEQVGTAKLQYHFSVIHIKKWLGSSPDELVRYYKKHITV